MASFGITGTVTTILIFVGKLATTACTTILAYVWLTNDTMYTMGDNAVLRPILPCVIVGIFAFIVSTVFFEVVGVAIDTILLNYCLDMSKNGQPKAAADKLGEGGG